MKHQLTYWIMPLVLGFAFVTGCQQKEKPAADRVHEMLADSSSRAMVEQNICTDHQMSNHLMVQARTDTAMCSNLYKTMMADSAMNCRMQMSMGSSMRGSSMGGSSMGGSCNMPSSSMMKDSKTPDHSVRHPKSGSMKMRM
jgi:hypothetical protein